ncbi:MAG: hypothetical protein ACM3S1_13195 [Hyphomicrobiales bacterium]
MTTPAEPGERWGGFLFAALGSRPVFTPTPAPAGMVPQEELIPSAHPGTRTFKSVEEVAQSGLVEDQLLLVPSTTPAGYELAGAYVVAVDGTGTVDYALSYVRADAPRRALKEELFAPDLWIGWTTRAPQPIVVSTAQKDLGDGRVGSAYEKATVRGQEAVFQAWTNPAGMDRSLRINSALIWFDDSGRQFWVHGDESASTLISIAESLTPYDSLAPKP